MSPADEDEDEDLAQNDDPEPFDQDPEEDENATETIDCPHCGREIFESAEFCHHCGKYISQEDTGRRNPLWYNVGVLLCVVIILLTALGFVTMLFMH